MMVINIAMMAALTHVQWSQDIFVQKAILQYALELSIIYVETVK